MRVSDPLNTLAAALVAARQRDLPSISWSWQGRSGTRRPRADEIDVRLFLQEWSDTSLGFDLHSGLAGQAMTTAPTVVVTHGRAACVYFGEDLAYTVAKLATAFYEDMRTGHMAKQSLAVARYGACCPTAEGDMHE